jgi:hypothetical protein
MKANQFAENPTHHRMLIDLMQRAHPAGNLSSDKEVEEDEGHSHLLCM